MAFILLLMTSLGFGSITTLFTLVKKDYFNEFSQKVSDLYGTTTLYGATVSMESVPMFFLGQFILYLHCGGIPGLEMDPLSVKNLATFFWSPTWGVVKFTDLPLYPL